MNDEDFVVLENELRDRFRSLGVPELGRDEHYRRSIDGGDHVLLSPRERVIAQLEALERLISLYDRHVHDDALKKIRFVLRQAPRQDGVRRQLPARAVVVYQSRLTEEPEHFDLSNLPRLKGIRRRALELVKQLREG